MARQQTKLLIHPDRDQIISKLASGESVRSIADWLKIKYPDSLQNQISSSALDAFRKEKLNIDGIVLNDIRATIKEQQLVELNEGFDKSIKRNKKYQERLNEVVDMQVDWKKKLLGIMNAIEGRFEQLYDKNQDGPGDLRIDNVLLRYVREVITIVQEIRKIEGAPDQIVQHNVTIQAIDQHAIIFQEAIKEAISELDIQTGSMIMDKIVTKVEALKVRDVTLRTEKDIQKINLMTAKILPFDEDDDE
jgi:hypothetical protein